MKMSVNNAASIVKYNNNASGYNNNANYEGSKDMASRDASTANNARNINPANMNLRSIEEIPEPYRTVFDKYHNFNVIQSKVFNDVFYTDEPLAISAPTGSGKTVVFELAIVKLLLSLEMSSFRREYKIIYISPTKALCEERLVDWHRKFSNFGVNCVSATGDSNEVDCSFLMNSNIIITTPEKWDSVTRSWRNYRKLVQKIKLFMIDEIHLLNEESRGPVLEAVVSRMKTIQECVSSSASADLDVPDRIRFIAVSATIPNVEDIAEWLGISTKAAVHYKFHDDMRPVKLQKVVLGYPYNPSMSSFFKFDIMLCYKLHNILLQHAKGKPTLIFCSTRKSVELTAKHISLNLTINLSQQQKQILVSVGSTVSDGKVRELLVHGVGYHHAGLLPESRKTIENVFRDGNLPILVTTSTLAMGVNLPAHLVIIKSTKYYANGEYKDYSESTLYQMIGRAGRPQFDTSATAVIMTTASDKSKYENMVGGSQAVESRLHKHLVEHLNAEVVLRTITDLGVAMQWLTSTFLYIRARKNPKFYGLPQGLTLEQLDKKLLDMCHIEINKLSKAGMLTVDSNILITPTFTGTLMARNYLALETMKLFTQVTGKEQLQQILSLISKCHEYSEIYLRTTDKKALNLLNNCRGRETIRFKLTGKIKTLDMKINCIIQAVLGCLEIMESSLIVEAQKIIRIAERVLNCLAEYLEEKPNCFSCLLNTLILLKCCRARIWENSPFVSRQLHGIGVALSNALVAAEKTDFESILNANPRDIERIINRKPPTGDKIKEQLKHLPRYKLVIKETGNKEGKAIDVTVTLENATNLIQAITVESEGVMNFLIGDDENNIIVYEKYTHSYMIENLMISKSIQVGFKENRTISAFFLSENWVGFDAEGSIVLDPMNEADEQKSAKKSVSENKNKRSSSYMQHVIETYFKTKKPRTKENNLKKAVGPIEKQTLSTSSELPANESEKSDGKIGEIHKSPEVCNGSENDENALQETKKFAQDAKSDRIEKVNENFEVSTNEESSPKNENKEMQSNFTNNIEQQMEINRTDLFIKKNNVLKNEASAFLQVNVKLLARNREKERQSLKLFQFEDNLHNIDIPAHDNSTLQTENNEIQTSLGKFTFSSKKLIHNETETDANLRSQSSRKRKHDPDDNHEPEKNLTQFEKRNEIKSIIKDAKCIENGAKSLTWSSPLVTSPLVKFSPNVKYEKTLLNTTSCDNFLDTSNASKINISNDFKTENNVPIFPLSDKAWTDLTQATQNNSSSEAEKQLQIKDMVSLESFGFTDKTEENSIQIMSNNNVLPQANSKLHQSKEINSGDYYLEKMRPVKIPPKFSGAKNLKYAAETESISSAADIEKVDVSVSTDSLVLDAPAKPQKISVVGNTVSNYFSFAPLCEKNRESESNFDISFSAADSVDNDESRNQTNFVTQKPVASRNIFYTREKEETQTQKMFEKRYSWENEFLENEFDGNESDEQSLPESIKLYRNEECRYDIDGIADISAQSLENRNEAAFNISHSYQRPSIDDEGNRFYHPAYSESNNLRRGPSRHDFVNTVPTELYNDVYNIQNVDCYDPQRNIAVKSDYFCTRRTEKDFYRNEYPHVSTMNQSYFQSDGIVDQRPALSQNVFHRQNLECYCCSNQRPTSTYEARQFAEQMHPMMQSRDIDCGQVIRCGNQNSYSSHSDYIFPQQNFGANAGHRFNYFERDGSVEANYYSNQHCTNPGGIHQQFAPSCHPIQFERAPSVTQAVDKSLLMNRYLHSRDLNDYNYLPSSREVNSRFVNRNSQNY